MNAPEPILPPDRLAALVDADTQRQAARLAQDGVTVRPYGEALPTLAALPADSVMLLDPKRVTWGLREAVPTGVKVVEAINPSTLAKSRKTDAEAAFIREAMERDGAAMCAFYAWLEQALGRCWPWTNDGLGAALRGQWVGAINDAAAQPGATLAAVPLIVLAEKDGVLDRLKRQGLPIVGPAW